MESTQQYIPGPAVGHDWDYERDCERDAQREAAIDAAKSDYMDELTYFATTKRFTGSDKAVFEQRIEELAEIIFGDSTRRMTNQVWLGLLKIWEKYQNAPASPEQELGGVIGEAIEDAARAYAREAIKSKS